MSPGQWAPRPAGGFPPPRRRSEAETGEWMHAFNEILITPPAVDILRIDERPA
jgi:hypothetical protein